MINAIRTILAQLIDDIDAGNTHLSEPEMMEMLDFINRVNARNHIMTKYEACELLNISRATFDRRVSDGTYPKGISKQGSKELLWRESDLTKK